MDKHKKEIRKWTVFFLLIAIYYWVVFSFCICP